MVKGRLVNWCWRRTLVLLLPGRGPRKWGQKGGLSLSGATFRLGEGAAEIQETFIILGHPVPHPGHEQLLQLMPFFHLYYSFVFVSYIADVRHKGSRKKKLF